MKRMLEYNSLKCKFRALNPTQEAMMTALLDSVKTVLKVRVMTTHLFVVFALTFFYSSLVEND